MLKTQNLNASYKLFTVSTVVDGGGGGGQGKGREKLSLQLRLNAPERALQSCMGC